MEEFSEKVMVAWARMVAMNIVRSEIYFENLNNRMCGIFLKQVKNRRLIQIFELLAALGIYNNKIFKYNSVYAKLFFNINKRLSGRKCVFNSVITMWVIYLEICLLSECSPFILKILGIKSLGYLGASDYI